MTPRSGYSPTSQQPNSTSRTKFVDGSPSRQGLSGFDFAAATHLGDGFLRKLFVRDFEAGTAERWTAAGGDVWQRQTDEEARAAEQARIDAEREASERIAAEEAAELDAEHLERSRLAEHLPPELAAFLDKMIPARRREREAAILKKVGWRGVGLIELDPAMLAALAEVEAERYRKRFPARDEDGNLINQEPDHRRGRDAKIWRKRLRRDQGEALVYVSAAVGAPGGPAILGRPLYVGDYELGKFLAHQQRTREILADLWLIREDDPTVKVCMLDVDATSRKRKAAERRMLIDMMLYRWRMLGWAVCWITITLPGEYVPHSTNEGRRATEWNPELGPLEAMAKIQDDFHGTMALIRERGIRPQGWWNAQPQQSGTPHRHILVAVPTIEDARGVCDAFRKKFSTRKNDEDGPDRGCDASVIGDDDPKYRRKKGKNGEEETPRSAAMYSARYATRFEKLGAAGDDDDGDQEEGASEQTLFEAWTRSRGARTHTWLGLDAQRSPVDLWRTHWNNALRSDYQPSDARMALTLRHMRLAQAAIHTAVKAHAKGDTETLRQVQEDAAREAWHAAIAVGMWPDADLDQVELIWLEDALLELQRATAAPKDRTSAKVEAMLKQAPPDWFFRVMAGEAGEKLALNLGGINGRKAKRSAAPKAAPDALPPVPLREERESIYGETYKAIVGAVGVTERFRLSGKPTRAELFEAAESVGVDVERPRAKLRRQHVLDSLDMAGVTVTWRERKLTLTQLHELAERLGVTVHVPTVEPRADAAMRALKDAGFGFSKRPDGSLVGFDLSGEILMRNEHRWVIVDSETAAEMAAEVEAQAAEEKARGDAFRNAAGRGFESSEGETGEEGEGRKRDHLSDSPNYPRIGPGGPLHEMERPPW